jgi:hypothetical protein
MIDTDINIVSKSLYCFHFLEYGGKGCVIVFITQTYSAYRLTYGTVHRTTLDYKTGVDA